MNMQTLMKRLVQQRENLSQLERQVLDHFIRYPERLVSLKLEEAAKEMFVSTATISRTCKRLGFQGFQDFKLQLHLYLRDEDPAKNEGLSASLSAYVKRYEKDIQEVLHHLDENKLKQAASMLAEARQVEWFGVGHSYSVCWDASKKLLMLGKSNMARMDWDDLRCAAQNLSKDDLAIFVSYSGETLNILEYAHIVKHQGTPILSLVGTKSNRLTELSDLVFYTPIEHCYFNGVDMCSRAPFQIYLDLLVLEYGNHSLKDRLWR
ncbi:MAG: MurR/RpiR family transcriptional regulator [Paenibacillus macerans]|nr:MurR/RpiR family transcriptional regulator [Paenibacillus macerans]MBS5910994.1 MurR/RpiR family transcriptional regulator [Paenibacillus macerans]MDU7476678.1 MurR/RpiR family transcriptional regulator [Paenibacillus macerans]UMV50774.1 MurR/RpiR family transcriptional regulator [Paenibacillus macerans]